MSNQFANAMRQLAATLMIILAVLAVLAVLWLTLALGACAFSTDYNCVFPALQYHGEQVSN